MKKFDTLLFTWYFNLNGIEIRLSVNDVTKKLNIKLDLLELKWEQKLRQKHLKMRRKFDVTEPSLDPSMNMFGIIKFVIYVFLILKFMSFSIAVQEMQNVSVNMERTTTQIDEHKPIVSWFHAFLLSFVIALKRSVNF